MDPSPLHVIKYIKIEVTTTCASQVQSLQKTIDRSIAQHIIPLLNKLFTHYVPENIVIHLDKLILDVGRLSKRSLTKKFPLQIAAMLGPMLQKGIHQALQNPHRYTPLPAAQLQAIAYYLSEGHIAWWMPTQKEIEKSYTTLLQQAPLQIEQLWHGLKKKDKAVQRFVASFDKETVENTVKICWGKEDCMPILHEISYLLHQTAVLTNFPYAPKQKLLAMALSSLLTHPQRLLHRIDLFTLLLKEVAHQTSIDYASILHTMQTYYKHNKKRIATIPVAATIQLWLTSLHELTVTPPTYWYKNRQLQEKITEDLKNISQHAPAQLKAMLYNIQSGMKQPAVRTVIKHWIKEKKNRTKLIQALSSTFFIRLVEAIEPTMIALFSGYIPIVEDSSFIATWDPILKDSILAYCSVEAPTVNASKEIKKLLDQHITATLPAIGLPQKDRQPSYLIEQEQEQASTPRKEIPNRDNRTLPLQKLLPTLQSTETSLLPTDTKSLLETHAKEQAASEEIVQNPFLLRHIVHFLLYNALPHGQSVPAYFIDKSLAMSTAAEIAQQLTVICQETAILETLLQYATEIAMDKLLQAFIPFATEHIDQLRRVITQANLLPYNNEEQTKRHALPTLLITAAIAHPAPTTLPQYTARLLFYLGGHSQLYPTLLCDQLASTAQQLQYAELAATFIALKQPLACSQLEKIEAEAMDPTLWPLQEKLERHALAVYYSQLLPALKQINPDRTIAMEAIVNDPAKLHQWISQSLPSLPHQQKTAIYNLLITKLNHTLRRSKAIITQKWKHFLYTGNVGHYAHATELLEEIIRQLPTFPLAFMLKKTVVRKQLMQHFTPTQLLLLVQKLTPMGSNLQPYLASSYSLWCATQGILAQENTTKMLFWDKVLEMLPQLSPPFHPTRWLNAIIIQWSSALGLTPLILLQTFKVVIADMQTLPEIELLRLALDKVLTQQLQSLQKEATQQGCKTAALEQLYLLVHSGTFLFSQPHGMTLDKLEKELVQCITEQPASLITMLKQPYNKNVIARRMVYYFSPELSTKIIAHLAKSQQPFVESYLQLFNQALPDGVAAATWQRELLTATLTYLLTVEQWDSSAFLTTTLFSTRYDTSTICQLIASVITVQPTSSMAHKIISLLQPMGKLLTYRDPLSAALTPLPEEPYGSSIAAATKNNTYSDKRNAHQAEAEEISLYTSNSGLVFLWPFLYDFFTAHHLMLDTQFFCEQAAHNAVYLLQYLCKGKLNHPESLLTIPKLLCGLTHDTVLLPYRSLQLSHYNETETALLQKSPLPPMETIETNSQKLIEKVIKRWKNVSKHKKADQTGMTTATFRHYFLNKPGILRKLPDEEREAHSSWNLTIIPQDEDDLTLLPPWSMDEISLPWMQTTLKPFWIATE
ncbi:MAG: contractile injection system tape measure protein [Candidatus Cardinium sp.]|nr:contractile injection system tape measure protein [Candidatus Cardinium sp.]